MDKLNEFFRFLDGEQKQLLRIDEITTFRNMIMEAGTHEEIDHIAAIFNDLLLDIPKLRKHIKSAKHRINVKGRMFLETYYLN